MGGVGGGVGVSGGELGSSLLTHDLAIVNDNLASNHGHDGEADQIHAFEGVEVADAVLLADGLHSGGVPEDHVSVGTYLEGALLGPEAEDLGGVFAEELHETGGG